MKKYENFCKALRNLQEAATLEKPYNVVEQTGIIALFEICFEQSWKMMKELLEEHGRVVDPIGSAKSIIKIAFQCSMINDEELWLELLQVRNLLTHTYSEEDANNAIDDINNKYIAAFEELKKEVEKNWLDF